MKVSLSRWLRLLVIVFQVGLCLWAAQVGAPAMLGFMAIVSALMVGLSMVEE